MLDLGFLIQRLPQRTLPACNHLPRQRGQGPVLTRAIEGLPQRSFASDQRARGNRALHQGSLQGVPLRTVRWLHRHRSSGIGDWFDERYSGTFHTIPSARSEWTSGSRSTESLLLSPPNRPEVRIMADQTLQVRAAPANPRCAGLGRQRPSRPRNADGHPRGMAVEIAGSPGRIRARDLQAMRLTTVSDQMHASQGRRQAPGRCDVTTCPQPLRTQWLS